MAQCISRKPAKDPDNFEDSEVLRMLQNSSINDSGLTSRGRQPDNDIDGRVIYISENSELSKN